jgi:hypothetical protein
MGSVRRPQLRCEGFLAPEWVGATSSPVRQVPLPSQAEGGSQGSTGESKAASATPGWPQPDHMCPAKARAGRKALSHHYPPVCSASWLLPDKSWDDGKPRSAPQNTRVGEGRTEGSSKENLACSESPPNWQEATQSSKGLGLLRGH